MGDWDVLHPIEVEGLLNAGTIVVDGDAYRVVASHLLYPIGTTIYPSTRPVRATRESTTRGEEQ